MMIESTGLRHAARGTVLLLALLAGCTAGVGTPPSPPVTPSVTTASPQQTPTPTPTSTPAATATSSPLPPPPPSTPPPPTTTQPPTTARPPSTPQSPTPTPTTVRPTPSTSPPPATTPPRTCDLRGYAGQDVERLNTTRKVVALTFDGGGSARGAREILDTLSAEDVRATFFLTGRFAQDNPSLAAEIGRGYPVGNHSQTHPDLTTLTRAQVVDQIRNARAAIREAAGVETRPLFRFPLGARNSEAIKLVNEECYIAFRWTVDTLGWQGTTGGRSAQFVHDRVMDALRPGAIVLMHIGGHPQDGSTLDADALPSIIDSIRAAGYEFVTLPG